MRYSKKAEKSHTIPVISSEKSVPTMSATTFMGPGVKSETSDRKSSFVFCDNIVMSRRRAVVIQELNIGEVVILCFARARSLELFSPPRLAAPLGLG